MIALWIALGLAGLVIVGITIEALLYEIRDTRLRRRAADDVRTRDRQRIDKGRDR